MKFVMIALITLNVLTANAQQDTAKTTAQIKEATVYYGYGAELTHSAAIKVSKDTRFIMIDGVSTEIDLNSLQISVPENISLMSQQFSIYTAPEKPLAANPMTKKITDSIADINKEIAVIMNRIDIDQTVLDKTDELIKSTIATSGNKTELTAEVLKLIDYYSARIEKNKKAIFDNRQTVLALQIKISAMNDRLSLANTRPVIDEKDRIQPTGRIIMQVVCRDDQQADIALSYYTNRAGWQPVYDIRVNTKTNALKLVYKASVTQSTGVNWKKTKITLSTGTPNFTTAAPLLNAWYLQLFVPELYNAVNNGSTTLSVTNNITVNTIQAYDKRKAAKEEDAYYLAKTVPASTIEKFTSLKQGLLNTNFEIDLPYDIESNGLAHSINIKEKELGSKLKNYAVPKLDPDAYLLAEIADWESLDLIPGNANIIMDDTYIGRSFIDPNTTADTLNLSLGKDKRVAVKRSLVKDASLSKIKDANIKQTFTYELTVKNNKITDVDMMVKDQYPLSNVKEVETELTDNGGAAVNTDIGVLTWRVNLKAGESKKFRFSYTVKYPKDKKIANLK